MSNENLTKNDDIKVPQGDYSGGFRTHWNLKDSGQQSAACSTAFRDRSTGPRSIENFQGRTYRAPAKTNSFLLGQCNSKRAQRIRFRSLMD